MSRNEDKRSSGFNRIRMWHKSGAYKGYLITFSGGMRLAKFSRIMPRKPLIRSREHPYHITARVNNRDPFPLDQYYVWEVFRDELVEISVRFETKIHAFVLMNNHFHLLISTPKLDIGVVMQHFLRSVTKTINLRSGRSGRVFGSRYHGSLIDTLHYFDIALKYLYRNPVKAGIVEKVEKYPYCTLRAIVQEDELSFKIWPPFEAGSLVLNDNLESFLKWLNEPFQNEREVARALKKTKFSPCKTDWKKILVNLKCESYSPINTASIQK